MSIQLKLKKGETVERGLKRLKKILDKEGLLKTIRDQPEEVGQIRLRFQRGGIQDRAGERSGGVSRFHIDG